MWEPPKSPVTPECKQPSVGAHAGLLRFRAAHQEVFQNVFPMCCRERPFADRAMNRPIRRACVHFRAHNLIVRFAAGADEINHCHHLAEMAHEWSSRQRGQGKPRPKPGLVGTKCPHAKVWAASSLAPNRNPAKACSMASRQ